MVRYNIITFCRMCRARFVTSNSKAKEMRQRIFCDKCKKIADREE